MSDWKPKAGCKVMCKGVYDEEWKEVYVVCYHNNRAWIVYDGSDMLARIDLILFKPIEVCK